MKIESQYGSNAISDFLPIHENNRVTISRLSRISAQVGRTSVYGIKYVIKGSENYVINGQKYRVDAGQYLVVNKGQDLTIDYKNRDTVYGLCVSLDEKLLGKVYQDLITEEDCLLNDPHDERVSLPDFHEMVYSPDDCIGKFLKKLSLVQYSCEKDCPDIYYDLAYRLLVSQKITQQRIQKLKASKASTKKELFSRLNMAKNIMDDDFTHKIGVADLARAAALSEFHFFRSFKEAFGQSPYQYVLARRLKLAKVLLLKGKLPITEVAYQAGFNDIFSFSKAFKKEFHISPSLIGKASALHEDSDSDLIESDIK